MRKTILQYGARKYPNKKHVARDIWYVYDYWNGCVMSTPYYSQQAANGRARDFNGHGS